MGLRRFIILSSVMLGVFLLFMGAVGCTRQFAASDAKKQEKQEKKEPKSGEIESKVGEALRNDKSVFLYFHSDMISDSLDQLPMVKKVAKGNNAEVITVKAEDNRGLRGAYEVDYVPTVFLLRPDSGLAYTWVVDIPEKELVQAVKAKIKPGDFEKRISKAVKDKKPHLIFFMAKWCGYCMRLVPEVERFQKEYSNCVEVITVDVDEAPYMQAPYAVSGIPVVLLADGSGVLEHRTGYPHGYDRYIELFEGMGADMKTCKAGAKKEGEKS